mgnify:CR=1 FL=1
MSQIPHLLAGGRGFAMALVAAGAVGEALAAGAAAFAARDIFRALHQGQVDIPVWPLVVMLVAGVSIAALRVAARSTGEWIGQGFAIALRREILVHVSLMPGGAVALRRQGALAIRFVGDLAAARNWSGLGVARLVSAAIVVPGAGIALYLLHPSLALAAAVPLSLTMAAMVIVGARIVPLHRDLRRKRANLAIDMMERVPVAPELRLMGRDRSEVRNLVQRGEELRDSGTRRVFWSECLRKLPDIGVCAAGAGVLATAFSVNASPATAAGSLAMLAILAQPLRNLARIWDYHSAWKIARLKCEQLLAMPTLPRQPSVATEPSTGPGRLVFSGVTHSVLRNLSVEAEPGMKIAIIGPNGAGKSTCLALAAGLEQPMDGRVELDGAEVSTLAGKVRRQRIVYVGPNSPILQGSLRRALTLGIRPRPGDEHIVHAAEAFGLSAVMNRLGGLGGRIAEAGRNLSTGEARRVHLVRAMLGRPDLLLLDAVDDGLDDVALAALARLVGQTRATTLLVSNNSLLVRQCDAVWSLAGGLLEDGDERGKLPIDHPDIAASSRLRHVA